MMDGLSHLTPYPECGCPPRLQEVTWRTWFLMSDLAETSYKHDKASQTISLIVESNCYMTKEGLT